MSSQFPTYAANGTYYVRTSSCAPVQQPTSTCITYSIGDGAIYLGSFQCLSCDSNLMLSSSVYSVVDGFCSEECRMQAIYHELSNGE